MRALVAVVFLLSSACATSSGFGVFGAASFPDQDKVAAIAAAPAPAAAAAPVKPGVASFTLVGPFPERVGDAPLAAGDPAADVVRTTVALDKTSENLGCAAREIGRIVDQTGGFPDARLERYVLLRCGATVESVAIRTMSWSKIDDKNADAELVAHDRDAIVADLGKLASGDALVGAAFVRSREKKTALVVMVAAHPRARVHAGPQVAAGGSFVVAGTINGDAEVAMASITAGAIDAVECVRDASAVLPQFRFTCPVAAADAVASVDVSVRRSHRVLGEGVASVMVVQRPADANTWTRADYGAVAHEGRSGPRLRRRRG